MPYAAMIPELVPFQQHLVGTWNNKPFPGAKHDEGGMKRSFSYNIMPLPQVCAEPAEPDDPDYILKNFSYYERLRFNDTKTITIPTVAPNRGGRYNQLATALFYDQQVHFAEGPDKDKPVHVENGAWLSLATAEQPVSPYGKHGVEPGLFPPQPSDLDVAKQIAVPHGNSVLALGAYEHHGGNPVITGAPEIPVADPPYPTPGYLSVVPYTTQLKNLTNF